MMRALSLIILLAACQTEAQPEPPKPGLPEAAEGLVGPDNCGMADYADLLGQPEDAAPQSEDGLIRVLHPGDMMTMDHRENRLNIHIGPDGLISQLRCG